MPFRTSPVVDRGRLAAAARGRRRDRRAHARPPGQAQRLELGGVAPARRPGRPDPLRRRHPGRRAQGEGRAFCAGIDLGMPEDRVTGRSPAEKVRNYYEGIRWVHERFRVFSELPQPIVAAVHGYCLGFGFELALDGRHPDRRRRRDLRPPEAHGRGLGRRRRRPPAGPRGRRRLGQAAGADRPADRRGDRRAARHRPAGHRRATTWSRRPWPSPGRSPTTPRSPSRASSGRSTRSPTAAWPRRSSSRRCARRSSSSPTTCPPGTPPRRPSSPSDFEGK